MKRLGPVFTLLALPGAVLFAVALVGLGLLRELPVGLVVTVAALGLLLPLAVGASLIRERALGSSLGFLLGPWIGLVLLPAYFPGERDDALAAGSVIFAQPLSIDPSTLPMDALDALLPSPVEGRLVPAAASEVVASEPPDRVPLPPPRDADPELPEQDALPEDAVVLPYEGTGRSLSVPATFVAGDREAEVWMLFDTGATITTVDSDTLRELGVRVPSDAPSLTVRTANGEREARVVLLDRVWIGGFAVEGVSVSVCDECSDDRTIGLLGLNVSGRFLVTVDQARKEIVLQPRAGAEDRSVDISPWLDIRAQASRWPDGRVEVEIAVDNRADREVQDTRIHIDCGERFEATFEAIAPEGSAETIVSLPRGAECEEYTVSLGEARW